MAHRQSDPTARPDDRDDFRAPLATSARDTVKLVLDADLDAARDDWDREQESAADWPASTDNWHFHSSAD